jgi:hypothetical protein
LPFTHAQKEAWINFDRSRRVSTGGGEAFTATGSAENATGFTARFVGTADQVSTVGILFLIKNS